MTRYVVLNRQDHGIRSWKRRVDYKFTAKEQAVLLVAQEAEAACCEMPIGFVRHGEGLELALLCSFSANDNVYVAPDGHWIMRYIPMILRGHPFHHLRQPGSHQAVLCIDEDSECLQQGGNETFFNEDGTPSPLVEDAIKLHAFLDAARTMTRAAIAALAKANVIVPWQIVANIEKQVVSVPGFLRIDKEAFNKLDDATVLELRKVGALEIAYYQLASVHQIPTVELLTEMKERFRKTGGAPTSDQIADLLKSDRPIF
ncbi:SapC family protein [Bradyrhizobium sp. MOS002]|uniref:SapC family protein n=1 Tax=Bradyrhizobium sp. MOS002 TaxID=2133947 RepID=UPI0013048C6B|nr:SapC family protein [Bradyrhizobium sp. MOS002]